MRLHGAASQNFVTYPPQCVLTSTPASKGHQQFLAVPPTATGLRTTQVRPPMISDTPHPRQKRRLPTEPHSKRAAAIASCKRCNKIKGSSAEERHGPGAQRSTALQNEYIPQTVRHTTRLLSSAPGASCRGSRTVTACPCSNGEGRADRIRYHRYVHLPWPPLRPHNHFRCPLMYRTGTAGDAESNRWPRQQGPPDADAPAPQRESQAVLRADACGDMQDSRAKPLTRSHDWK